jgi:hypothetical protein
MLDTGVLPGVGLRQAIRVQEERAMGRIARLKVKGEPAVYHLVSRTTLEGFVLGDVEKDHLLG